MLLTPEPFAALRVAVDGIEAFLKLQTYDFTPILSTQPPSDRAARREYLENALEDLLPQLTMIQQLHDRIGAARNVILRRHSLGHSALCPAQALPPELLRIVV